MQIDAETLKFTNVLFVSELAINLISVSHLNSKGISVVFDAENASTTFTFKNNVIAHVNRIFNQFLLRNEIYLTSIEKTMLSVWLRDLWIFKFDIVDLFMHSVSE